MTALSDRIGGWHCTSIGSGGTSRFSQLSVTSVGEGLNFVEQGRHGGDEKVGDAEEEGGNGDQKQNARKRKHASKANEITRRMKRVMVTRNRKPAKKMCSKR